MKKQISLISLTAILTPFLLMGAGCASTDTGTEPGTDGQMMKEQSIEIKGSDTIVQLSANLAEAFAENNDVDISVTGGGSGVGIAALLNQEVQVANASRGIKDKERVQAEEAGVGAHEFIIARDGLSVIVHPSNQAASLSVDQIGQIYRGEVTNWNAVGGAEAEIVLYGRQSTSGTYSFFRDAAVQGDYSPTMRNMEGNQAIFDAVSTDVNGIGYVGVGYVKDENGNERDEVTVLPVAVGETMVSPLVAADVASGRYPLSRPLYQYLAEVPTKDSALGKFLLFEVSAEGQSIAEDTGFFPATDADMEANENIFQMMQ